jgi:hypothetical protein
MAIAGSGADDDVQFVEKSIECLLARPACVGSKGRVRMISETAAEDNATGVIRFRGCDLLKRKRCDQPDAAMYLDRRSAVSGNRFLASRPPYFGFDLQKCHIVARAAGEAGLFANFCE